MSLIPKILLVFLSTKCLVANSMVITGKSSSVTEIFEEHEVVPDVIPVAPTALTTVTYPTGVDMVPGEELTPTQVRYMPTVTWDANPDDYYTLLFVDADAPSRFDPANRSFEHWLVVNIPGNDVSSGDPIAEYIGSGPGLGSEFHRYIMLVYRQPTVTEFDEPRFSNTSADGRRGFSVVSFADRYNLGDPVAGNFYLAQYDDYVPELHQQLGISRNRF